MTSSPPSSRSGENVLGTAEDVCRLYGYRRIETPGFEDT